MGSRPADWGYAGALDDVGGRVAIVGVGVGESEHSQASGRDSVAIAAVAVERALPDNLRPSREIELGCTWCFRCPDRR